MANNKKNQTKLKQTETPPQFEKWSHGSNGVPVSRTDKYLINRANNRIATLKRDEKTPQDFFFNQNLRNIYVRGEYNVTATAYIRQILQMESPQQITNIVALYLESAGAINSYEWMLRRAKHLFPHKVCLIYF